MINHTSPALRVHAVMLGVRDVDAALAFYTEKLGLAPCGRSGDFAFVDAGGTMLVLSAQLAREHAQSGDSQVEIVLAVDSVVDAAEQLRARGCEFVSGVHPIDHQNDGAKFEDLDGHRFSLYGKP